VELVLSRADRLFFNPGKGVRVMFKKDPCLGESQNKFCDMPVVKQIEMDPPAFLPETPPASSTARLDLNSRAYANGECTSIVTDNFIPGSRQLLLLSTTPCQAMGMYVHSIFFIFQLRAMEKSSFPTRPPLRTKKSEDTSRSGRGLAVPCTPASSQRRLDKEVLSFYIYTPLQIKIR
jgi:hypothetical protein